jgi:hypothetical protein
VPAYSFTAIGYEGASVTIDLVDDEPPAFQNLADRFDVNNDGRTSALDALRVINELARRGGPVMLTVDGGGSPSIFVDVNGDYRLSALDALQIINELARRLNSSSTEKLAQRDGGFADKDRAAAAD